MTSNATTPGNPGGENFYKRVYRTKEAAAYLGVSPKTIRKLAQDGILPVLQECEGAPWRFDVRDLDKYVDSSKRLI